MQYSFKSNGSFGPRLYYALRSAGGSSILLFGLVLATNLIQSATPKLTDFSYSLCQLAQTTSHHLEVNEGKEVELRNLPTQC